MEALDRPAAKGTQPDLWDGQASGRIVDVLERVL
jgi:hypothetical protein